MDRIGSGRVGSGRVESKGFRNLTGRVGWGQVNCRGTLRYTAYGKEIYARKPHPNRRGNRQNNSKPYIQHHVLIFDIYHIPTISYVPRRSVICDVRAALTCSFSTLTEISASSCLASFLAARIMSRRAWIVSATEEVVRAKPARRPVGVGK